MKELNVAARISDYQLSYGISKKSMEESINHQLASHLAREIVKDISEITVSRKIDDPLYRLGETIYTAKVFIMTEKEVQEYHALKRFQDDMRRFVR